MADEAEKPPGKLQRKALQCDPGKSEKERARNYARLVMAPEVAAYRIISNAEKKTGLADAMDVPSLIEELRQDAAAVNRGDLSQAEAMLINQATALQTLFGRLSELGLAAEYLNQFETYMRMALRAQAQCTRTLEVLSALKNPPVVIAKQANVTTGPQQNNFGVPSRTRETEIKPTELLEAIDGERLDTGTAAEAVGSDPALATVDAQHRA
jgi:hypothetical protein